MTEPEKAAILMKVRAAQEGLHTVQKAASDAGAQATEAARHRRCVVKAPLFVRERVEEKKPLPRLVLAQGSCRPWEKGGEEEEVLAVIDYIIGKASEESEKKKETEHVTSGVMMQEDVFVSLMDMIVAPWARK